MGDVEKEDRTSESVDFIERSVTDTPPGDVSGHVEPMAVDEAKEGVDPASHAHEDQRRVPPPTRGVAEDVGSDATNVMDHPPASVPEQAGRLPRRASTSSGSQDTQPGGWPRRGGAGIAASDNPPTTAPSGGSPSSPASSRAPVRPPRTPPHPSHTCARSYLNPPFLLLTCAHHLAPCLCACACAQFAPFSGRIRALTNSGDAGSASDGAVRDDRLFAAHGACYARPLRTHPACRAFCCPPHLPACIHSQHVLI